IRRIATFLDERDRTGGSERAEIDRRLHSEIDSLFRTSPIGLKKPTPVEEADTVINVFDTTLFSVIPNVYRRFDDWI
ncbi:phosphoenolpyruvate carboxylase, partial [Escherichia coli]|nr:phosphoenolpyruvate carboxylase [Escherichia coli]